MKLQKTPHPFPASPLLKFSRSFANEASHACCLSPVKHVRGLRVFNRESVTELMGVSNLNDPFLRILKQH